MGHNAAEATQLFVLHDITATWLSEQVPLYVPYTERAHGQVRMHKGLPAIDNDVVDHGIQFPGTLVEELEPRAARDLHISNRDVVEATFVPMQYNMRDKPPQLWRPTTLYTVRDEGRRRGDIEFEFSPATDSTFYLSWNGRGEFSQGLDKVECTALTLIAQRLEDFYQAMCRDGTYPDDVVRHREEREITEAAQRLTAQFEQAARTAALQQSQRAPAYEDVDPWALHQLQYEHASHDKTYTYVSRRDIEVLYDALLQRMLACNRALFVFPEAVAARMSQVVHEPELATRTAVNHLTLKTERSNVGHVASFIIGKTVLLRDGLQRLETDTFMIHRNRYIRILQFEEASRGRMVSSRTDARRPMTPVHMKAFHELLTWLEPLP